MVKAKVFRVVFLNGKNGEEQDWNVPAASAQDAIARVKAMAGENVIFDRILNTGISVVLPDEPFAQVRAAALPRAAPPPVEPYEEGAYLPDDHPHIFLASQHAPPVPPRVIDKETGIPVDVLEANKKMKEEAAAKANSENSGVRIKLLKKAANIESGTVIGNVKIDANGNAVFKNDGVNGIIEKDYFSILD